MYTNAMKTHRFETHLLTGIARVNDLLNDPGKAMVLYKKILQFDN